MYIPALMSLISLCVSVEGQGRGWGGRLPEHRGRYFAHRPHEDLPRDRNDGFRQVQAQGDLPRTRGFDFDASESRIQQWCIRKEIRDPRKCRCRIFRWCERRGGRGQAVRGICLSVINWNPDDLNCRHNDNRDQRPEVEQLPPKNHPTSITTGSPGD